MNLKKIYIIACTGISDLGKGWLTSSLGAISPDRTLPIKVDPLLNLEFPRHLGVSLKKLASKTEYSGNVKVSEDLALYHSVGMPVYEDCNLISGALMNAFLKTKVPEIRPGETKKRTFNDLSYYFAAHITGLVQKYNPERVVIEVGGTIDDREAIFWQGAFRFLENKELLGIKPEIVLLSYFDYAEADYAYRVKTQHIRRGLTTLMQTYYNLHMAACVVRRRHVPQTVSDEVLMSDLYNVAYETQIPYEKMVLFPNVERGELNILKCKLEKAGLN